MSHTPGPWSLQIRQSPDGMYEYVVHLNDKSREFNSWGWANLHRIIVYGNGLGQNQLSPKTKAIQDEAIANVRLIAAAPDLLVALKELLSFHDIRWVCDQGPPDEGWKSDELQAAFAAADAAIAKAEGRS